MEYFLMSPGVSSTAAKNDVPRKIPATSETTTKAEMIIQGSPDLGIGTVAGAEIAPASTETLVVLTPELASIRLRSTSSASADGYL